VVDGVGRKRWDVESRHAAGRRQLAENKRERMCPVELVVAKTGEDKRRHRLDLSRQKPQDVECRLIGPVKVVEHEDGCTTAGEVADQGGSDLVWPRAARDELL
jgi:hypothetical protein